MLLLPHQQRVVEERDELQERLRLLTHFLTTPTFDALQKNERHDLVEQRLAMAVYFSILQRRIAGFVPA